ncbi:MAG: pentapeptide repeat-containing protein [Bacteroidota bacterium]
MLNTKNIGNKIAEARKKLNISQAQLAQGLFISSQAVGKWERGESMPDITTFIRLAEILGVDLNYFSESFQSTTKEISSNEPSTKTPKALPIEKQQKKLNWDMSRGNWVNADFSGLKNLHDKFSASNMQNCKFIGSEMSGLLLKSNNIDSCDFSNSDFENSHIHKSYLNKNLFNNCSLKEADFFESYFSYCDFSNADFSKAIIKSGGFEKNIMTNAILNHTSFIGTLFADIVFEGEIEDCYFENCKFTRVTFQNANLINTFFKCKSLKRIRFINCQADRMTHEFLKNGKADLNGVTKNF